MVLETAFTLELSTVSAVTQGLTLAKLISESKPAASIIREKFRGLDALTSTEGLDWRAFVLRGLGTQTGA